MSTGVLAADDDDAATSVLEAKEFFLNFVTHYLVKIWYIAYVQNEEKTILQMLGVW